MATLVGHDGNYCCFALTRGFERIRAASSEERAPYETDGSASCEEKQGRRDRRSYHRRQDDVPAAVDWAWPIAPLCQLLVCAVHVLE